MANNGEVWKHIVNQLWYLQSCLDARGNSDNHLAFHCELCDNPKPAFSTQKALDQHKRIKHKQRTAIRCFVDDSGVCPCCKNNYVSRLRVLSHVRDPRRPKCKQYILSGAVAEVPVELVREFDLQDKLQRRAAQRSGHSTPLAVGSARTASGKRIGYASA